MFQDLPDDPDETTMDIDADDTDSDGGSGNDDDNVSEVSFDEDLDASEFPGEVKRRITKKGPKAKPQPKQSRVVAVPKAIFSFVGFSTLIHGRKHRFLTKFTSLQGEPRQFGDCRARRPLGKRRPALGVQKRAFLHVARFGEQAVVFGEVHGLGPRLQQCIRPL